MTDYNDISTPEGDQDADLIPADDDSANAVDDLSAPVRYRGATNDPFFGLLLAGAISVGAMPLASADPDLRYTITWGLLILFGVLAWLVGNFPRIGEEKPENLAWGIALGLILGIPLLAFGSGVLHDITTRIWADFRPGMALAFLVFIMPMGETLFFRGIMQELRPFWEVGLLATAWEWVLFFPHVNHGPLPLILALFFGMVNVLYSYVRMRNGLAASWLTQITVNLLILFFPFI